MIHGTPFTALALLAGVLLAGLSAGCTTERPGVMFPDGGFDADVGEIDSGMPPDTAMLPDPTIDPCGDSTLGESCGGSDDCNDRCFCNGVETCEGGVCVAGDDPCLDDVECTESACLEEVDRCFFQARHSMCGDADECNGTEVCDLAEGCRPGAPLYCNDESSCTIDSCDAAEGCLFLARDLDRDGHRDGRCGGDDCDDDPRFGTDIYPGAVENCRNRRDDDCDGSRDYTDSSCIPTNDTCATAELLPGAGTFSGSTQTLAGNYSLGCRASGPDAVFRLVLTEPHDVRVSVSGGGSGAGVALRSMAQCETGPDDKCGAGSPPVVLRRSVPAGEYAIIVKTSSGVPFDLNLQITDPTPIPPVDVCGPGSMDISAGGSFMGLFAEVEDDYALSCHTSTGTPWRDAAYVFTITSPKDVVLTASTSASFTPTTYLSLVTNCSSSASTLQCVSSSAAEIRRRGLAPGTYYVLLESSSADATMWTLNASITDPAPRNPADSCSSAVDITTTPGLIMLPTLELDAGTSCGGSTTSYRDGFFYFDLTATSDVTLTTYVDGSTHYVSLGTECGVFGSELRCRTQSGSLVQTWRSLAPGRYFATVTTTRSTGTMAAEVDITPPTPIPPNDRCTGAIVLTNGTSRRDTTVDFEDDAAGCTGVSYPDAYYTFTLAVRSRVILAVSDADASSTRFYLTLRDSCAGTTSFGCENDAPSTTINANLDPGTYYLLVETTATTTSDYYLDAFIVPI